MSIRKRQWSGGEAFVVDLMINRKRHRRQFGTRAEARAYELEVRQAGRDGRFRPGGSKITVVSLREAFFEHLEERHRRGKRMTRVHLQGLKAIFSNYIVGGTPIRRPRGAIVFEYGLANLRLSEITPEVVEEFQDRLFDMGLTKKTVVSVRNCLSVFLEFAKKKNYVADNATRSAELTETRNAKAKRRIKPPSKDLVRAINDQCREWFRTYFRLAALTGIRAGEQRALRWRHILFEKGILIIETRLDRWGNEDGQGAKTDAGNREIPIARDLIAELHEWRGKTQHCGSDDFIFTNSRGKPVCHTASVRYRFRKAYERAAAHWSGDSPPPPRPRWHDLRHFAASCWIEQGLSAKAIQEFIGHSSISTTMNIYGHLFPSTEHNEAMDRVAADVLGLWTPD